MAKNLFTKCLVIGVIFIFVSFFLLILVSTKIQQVVAQSPETPLEYSEIAVIGRGTTKIVAWHPTLNLIGVGGSQGVWIYSESFQDIAHFDNTFQNTLQLAWSPDGSKIASSGIDSTIWVRDSITGEIISSLPRQGEETHFLAWSPDGNKLASASGNEAIIWNISSDSISLTLQGHEDRITSISWSPDGSKIATASFDGNIRIWDALQGQTLTMLTGHTGSVFSAMWSPIVDTIASVGWVGDKVLMLLWDLKSNQITSTIQDQNPIVMGVWSPNGREIAGIIAGGVVKTWDIATGTTLNTFAGHSDEITSVSWSHDNTKLATSSDDHSVKIWSTSTGEELDSLKGHSGPVSLVKWNPTYNQIAVTEQNLSFIGILDPINVKIVYRLFPPNIPAQADVVDMSWSPNGLFLAASYEEVMDITYIWDLSGKPYLKLGTTDQDGGLPRISWSPDNTQIVSVRGGSTRTIYTINLTTEHSEIVKGDAQVMLLVWGPQYIAALTRENNIQIWDSSTYQSFMSLPSDKDELLPMGLMAWNSRGDMLAGISCHPAIGNCSLWIWDITHDIYTSYPLEVGVPPQSLAWHPNADLLAVDGQLWGISEGRPLAFLGFLNTVSWNPDGSKLVGGSQDGAVHIWQISYSSVEN